MPVLWLVASLNWDFSGRAVDHHKFNIIVHILGFPAGSDVKKSACNAGDPGSILGWEDPLEKGMATHSSILALRIPWTEEPGRLQSMESQRAGHN